MKTVDVIIPVYKPKEKFFRLISMLKKQDYPIEHIIIMNTEKEYLDEETLRIHHMQDEKETRITVYHLTKEEFDHGATRNLGVSHSNSDCFILMTDDAVPKDEHLVRKLIEGLYEQDAAICYARQLGSGEGLESMTRNFNYPAHSLRKTGKDLEMLGIKAFFASNVCCAYRRDVFDQLGGFVNHTIFNEDMIYARKALDAGFAIYYQAEAQVYHSHHYTCMQQLRRNFDLGVSQADHSETFSGIRSEKEGMRLIRTALKTLAEQHRYAEMFHLFVQSAFKYAGYRLGKAYRALPKALILALTMNRNYWKS